MKHIFLDWYDKSPTEYDSILDALEGGRVFRIKRDSDIFEVEEACDSYFF